MLQFFDAAAVARLCPYRQLVDALAYGLREPIVSPPRTHLDPPGDGSAFLIMPAWQGDGLIGVKMVSVWPANAALGKPTVSALYNVFSCADGMPVAVIDGTELTLRRTAAAAALGARLLARQGRVRLAVLGSGALAPEMAAAHASVLAIESITIWGRRIEGARDVVARLAARGIVATASASLEAVIAEADVIVAATTATLPNDDHAGTGRLLQFDADLKQKGVLWIKQTNHKLSGLTFGPDKTLYGFAPLNHAVIEVSADAKEKPLFDFGDRAFSNITFPKDGTILLGEHLTGTKTTSEFVSTKLPLMKGSNKVGDGHVYRYDKNRKLIAEYPTAVHGGMEGYHGVTSSVLADNDTRLIYISETGNRILQYDLATKQQLPDLAVFKDDPDAHFVLWMQPMPDKSLLVVTGANFLILDAKTGQKKRVYPMESFGWAAASPSVDGAYIYAGNFMDGDVAKLRLKDGVVVAKANIGEKRSLSGIAQFPG